MNDEGEKRAPSVVNNRLDDCEIFFRDAFRQDNFDNLSPAWVEEARKKTDIMIEAFSDPDGIDRAVRLANSVISGGGSGVEGNGFLEYLSERLVSEAPVPVIMERIGTSDEKTAQAVGNILILIAERFDKRDQIAEAIGRKLEIIKQKVVEGEAYDNYLRVLLALTRDREDASKYLLDIMGSMLEYYGFDPTKLFKVWGRVGSYVYLGNNRYRKSTEPEKLGEYFENIRIIRELENKQSGGALYLHKQDGINHFKRYPKAILERQYETREQQDKQASVTVLFPHDDFTNAFGFYETLIGTLWKKLMERGVELRIAEAGGKREALGRLLRIARKHGKMTGVIIGGHGDEEGIRLGNCGGLEDGVIRPNDMVSEEPGGNRRLLEIAENRIFIDDATVILMSCRQRGDEEGLAWMITDISNKGLTVKGSDGETELVKICPIFDKKGKLILNPTFSGGTPFSRKGKKT